MKEEVTLGYLESTHIPGEQRQARRRAFHAGMKAGSENGVMYQIGPEDDNRNPGPRVLPI